MKSSTLIASYLWKDTWSRWLEQPGSFLSRLFVGALLVATASLILAALGLMERTLRDRLETFGLDTLIIREMVVGHDPELLLTSDRPNRLAPLQTEGSFLRLRQLFVRGRTDWQKGLVVMAYPPEALPVLAPWISPETPLICFSDTLPAGVLIQVELERHLAWAVVRQPNERLRPLFQDTVILAPQGWVREGERNGYVEVTLFERRADSLPLPQIIHAVKQVFEMDRRPSPQIHSSLPWLDELELLQARQQQWRAGLALGLGLTIALVFGTVAILEFRQNMFIGALLRSLGVPARYLYFRQWIENALLANGAALLAWATLSLTYKSLFLALGFELAAQSGPANPLWSGEMVFILVCVNVGAFLSSLPVAVGLRRPVGTVLS